MSTFKYNRTQKKRGALSHHLNFWGIWTTLPSQIYRTKPTLKQRERHWLYSWLDILESVQFSEIQDLASNAFPNMSLKCAQTNCVFSYHRLIFLLILIFIGAKIIECFEKTKIIWKLLITMARAIFPDHMIAKAITLLKIFNTNCRNLEENVLIYFVSLQRIQTIT